MTFVSKVQSESLAILGWYLSHLNPNTPSLIFHKLSLRDFLDAPPPPHISQDIHPPHHRMYIINVTASHPDNISIYFDVYPSPTETTRHNKHIYDVVKPMIRKYLSVFSFGYDVTRAKISRIATNPVSLHNGFTVYAQEHESDGTVHCGIWSQKPMFSKRLY